MAFALATIGALLSALATLYALAALLCRPRTWRPPRRGLATVPVSVLKPLCGAEPNLERNLTTLCRQTHPCYQLVFGVRDPGDPAAAIVARLARRFPWLDMCLVADPRVHGSNLKVSNLINMQAAARHPWLVLADSDIGVGPDYLARVTAPLAEPGTGIVTCLYRGVAAGGFWSRLGVLFIDSWFAPSVRVASRGGGSAFGFGATIALRADTLARIGGFEAIKDRLADDFWLGELTRREGLATILSEVEVTTDVTERSLAQLWTRERRWMQTIRSLNPPGYAFCFVTFTLPMLALGLWLAPAPWNWAVALPGLGARMLLHWRAQPRLATLPLALGLASLRDCLLLAEWLSAFAGSTTRWRGHRLRVDGRHAAGAMPPALEKT